MNAALKEKFISAAKEENIPYLRSFITSEIINDPTFKNGDCHECMAYLKSKGIDITVPYELNPSEEDTPVNKELWTKNLFLRKVEYLRRNFAYDERIDDLRNIGRVAYADEIVEEKKGNFAEAPKGCRSEKKNTSLAAMIGAVTAVAAIIAVIAMLIKK